MLLFAIIIITIAHIIRILRWEFLIGTYEKPDGKRLTKSLALGYFINYFLPFRIGDLVRAMHSGKGMENGRGFSLATVVVERCLDILSVGILFVIFSISLVSGSSTTAAYYIALAVILFAALVVIYLFRKQLKKLIYNICGLLNEKYEEKLLRFFWALIWGFKDILNRLPKIKLIIYTVVMWGLYLGSYGFFSTFLKGAGISRSFSDVFFSLFDQKSLLSSGVMNGFKFSEENVWYALFMLVPLVLLYIIALAFKFTKQDNQNRDKLSLIPQTNTGERLTFLKMYFAGEKKEYIENYLSINRNILVLRDYSAGSNATTILCTDGENSFYRKYAFMEAAEKLSEQIQWIELNSSRLSVAKIINKDVNDGVCFYDMPYYHDAVTLFEYSQSGDYETSWNVIERVLSELELKLYSKGNGNDSAGDKDHARENLQKYIEEKIVKNLEIIANDKELSEILNYETVVINGKEYRNLKSYLSMFEKENLIDIFSNDEVTAIHGDLTVENIVYEKSRDSFYLIDPNSGNIFNSKFIDYAKLLQSLHGKYEYMMAVKDVFVSGNHIDYKTVESDAYECIYEKYKEYLAGHFSRDQIRSMYYHETVNWLRLMPYKLKKGKGALFFSGLIKVLNEVEKI